MTSPALIGFLAGSGLIAAIGAQNAFVLRQGVRREHVLAVVLFCIVADLILVAVGIAGVGALVSAHPGALTVATYGGAAFLLCYGALALKRAWRPAALTPADAAPTGLAPVLATCAALTFLNPHVYLDTVVLLGALANEHGSGRWLFGLGAVVASITWFTCLGLGARRLATLFSTPRTWRLLDGLVAATMFALGVSLLRSH